MKIARVFPRRTNATPIDSLAFYREPGLFEPVGFVDQVHISCTFTWDIPKAEKLAKEWEHIAPVEIGGVAFGKPSGEFIAGRYIKKGYTITSRGCPNTCWFCSVWKREQGQTRELPIVDGYNILDDNLLACSESHIRNVFAMLKRQKQRPEFTGGLEAKILKSWHVELLQDIKPKQMFFAYDTSDDLEPLMNAAEMLIDAGFKRRQMRCYVLAGYEKDTILQANKRLVRCAKLGMFPMMMMYKDKTGLNHKDDKDWKKLQWAWTRPAAIATTCKRICSSGIK